MSVNCLLCGVGGQGTVLAAKLLAEAAMAKGYDVKISETIGMSQRGGCVVSHVRFGEDVYSPLIPASGADVIIAFEPAEAVRCLPYLKDGGAVVVNTKAVKPVTALLSGMEYNGREMLDYLKKKVEKLVIVDGNEVCKKCGSSKILNVALLACAVNTGLVGISSEELKLAIRARVPEKFISLNLAAVEAVSERGFDK